MKISLPTKEEVGTWLTVMGVLCAGAIGGKGDVSKFLLPGFYAWCLLACFALLYLTIRATIRAAIRQRRDVAGK